MLLSGSTVCANLLLGPANIPDLLDSEVGADNGGHQPDTQPAMEKETGEQQYPESNSRLLSSPSVPAAATNLLPPNHVNQGPPPEQ